MVFKISIIVIVFNVENYIKESLDSILRQTIGFENLEVIMVDDCSNDKSGEIIDEYAVTYKNFKAIHLVKNSGGCGKPRNVGIEKATGDYIMFLDSDDYFANDVCEVLYNKIKKENVDIAFTKYVTFTEQTEQNVIYRVLEGANEIKVKKIDDDLRLLTTPPSVWTKIYNRKFILNNNLKFSENILAEDLVFVLDAFFKANGIILLNNHYGYYYRTRNLKGDESLSNSKNKKNLMWMANGYHKAYDILLEHDKKQYFPTIFPHHLEFWMNNFIVSNTTHSEKKELLRNISFLFKELKKYNINPTKEYLIPLFDKVEGEEYEDAILLAKIFFNFMKNQDTLQKQEYKNLLKAKEETIQEITSSNSWKLTKPLRNLGKWVRTVKGNL